jgi:site-specific recombinase XerD
MIVKINNQLAGGWNPFFENEDARMFEKLTNVANLFVENRRKELRKNTIRSYESFVKMLIIWANKNCPDIYASTFAQNQAIRYMDDLFAKKSVGVTTYNNHIKMARALFNWMKERCYTKQNPFDNIKLRN